MNISKEKNEYLFSIFIIIIINLKFSVWTQPKKKILSGWDYKMKDLNSTMNILLKKKYHVVIFLSICNYVSFIKLWKYLLILNLTPSYITLLKNNYITLNDKYYDISISVQVILVN